MNGLIAEKFSYDPFSKKVRTNPIPYYKEMRANHPVYYVEKYDMFVLTRFQDIMDALCIVEPNTLVATESPLPLPSMISHRNEGAPPFISVNPMGQGPMLPSPQHEQMRRAQITPLRPKAIAKIENFVRDLARERLKLLLPRGKFDVLQEYGGMVSAAITCHLYGIPLSETEKVLDAVQALAGYNEDLEGISTAAMFEQLGAQFILPAIERRRAAGADGSVPLIDGLINYRTDPDGRALSDEEIANQLTCVFVANTETPTTPAGQGLLALTQHPDQLAAIRADLEQNVGTAAEEMLRICSSAQWTMRTVHKDITIAGQPIKAGQRIIVSPFSAARDERVYENADQFIWNRKQPRTSLTFGFGQHHCVGNHMSRLQVRTLVHEFLAHVSDFEFAINEAIHNASYFHWRYTYLPVVIKSFKL